MSLQLAPPTARIRYIDGLRALAVLSVLLYHASHLSAFERVMREGRHGVDLFFVISGFCLSYPTLRAVANGGNAAFGTATFLAKRILRILPPYWIAVAAFAVLTIVLEILRFPLPGTIQATTAGDIAKQLFFLDGNLNFSNGSFWSLAVECRWYLLFPLLLALWLRNPKAFWLVAAASYACYHFTRLSVIDFATLPAFMSGIFAADLCVNEDRRAGAALWLLPFAFAFAFVCDHPELVALQDTIAWQAASLCLVIAVGHTSELRAFFSWRPLVFIGIASYSIYLYHEPIVGVLTYDLHWNWLLAAGIALVVGIAAWWTIERQTQLTHVKTELTAKLDVPIRRLLRFAGVPETTDLLGGAAAPTHTQSQSAASTRNSWPTIAAQRTAPPPAR